MPKARKGTLRVAPDGLWKPSKVVDDNTKFLKYFPQGTSIIFYHGSRKQVFRTNLASKHTFANAL